MNKYMHKKKFAGTKAVSNFNSTVYNYGSRTIELTSFVSAYVRNFVQLYLLLALQRSPKMRT